MTDSPRAYTNSEEIKAVVSGFESCETKPSDFHHREHLTVALWYLVGSTEEAAMEKMRLGLFRFLEHNDLHAYHETVTAFWIKKVRSFLADSNSQRPLTEIANEMLAAFDDVHLIDKYFSKERLQSDEARDRWIEPDVPFDF